LIVVRTLRDLLAAVSCAWELDLPCRILGGGANVLVSDAGFRGLVIVNRAGHVTFSKDGLVRAESGANLGALARRCVTRGLAGLEWAVSIPGTVGGAIINNAGAHGGDMAHNLRDVTLYFPGQTSPSDPLSVHGEGVVKEIWFVERMEYAYRASALKGSTKRFVVASATLALSPGADAAALRAKVDEYIAHRKRTQPPGASLGSMFKNPPGDYAGRLIEAAGLKGRQIGGVQISPVHANFFVNTGGGTASDYLALIRLTQETVQAQFGVALELEIELI
jgi:UDP-N-acetylmuramate dehydrogenase